MNILLLGSHHRLRQDFSEAGHQIITSGFREDSDIVLSPGIIPIQHVLKKIKHRMSPDLILLTDDSRPLLFTGMEDVDALTAWYAVDTHLHLTWHKECAKLFDFVFVAQKDFAAHFLEGGINNHIFWMPLYCNTRRDKKLAVPKTNEVSFVGSLNKERNPDRVWLIEQLAQYIPLHIASGDYVKVYNQSKIVLNQSAKRDVNFRTFEALGCGSFLLTERVENGLSDLFSEGTHLVLYEKNNIHQIVQTIRYYLKHDEERERIAAQGMNEVLTNHTSKRRVETMNTLFLQCDPIGIIQRRKENRFIIKRFAARLYATLACDEQEFPDALKNVFYSLATNNITEAFEGHLTGTDTLEVLYDALVFADMLNSKGKYDHAENILNKAASLGRKSRSGTINKSLSEIYCRLGIIYYKKNDLSAAGNAFQQSIRLDQKNSASITWLESMGQK